MSATTPARAGRPRQTSREEIAGVALALFAERGFEETTLDDVAAAVGVSRRTVVRYYDSKADLVWGTFSEQLDEMRALLREADAREPLMETIRRVVVAFNDYGDEQLPELRRRLTLITTVPALQGHSLLRYEEWSSVIAGFVAGRLRCRPDDHLPQVVAAATLGTAMATYQHWIRHPEADLLSDLDSALVLLATGFADSKLMH
jgi:TetR/AcrR family transcriptional regulator, regulator of mycofactocin system